MHHRRLTDKDPIMKIWQRVSPYFHVISVLVLLIFTLGVKSKTFDAVTTAQAAQAIELSDHEKRLQVQEINSETVKQSLQDIKEFWHIPHRK